MNVHLAVALSLLLSAAAPAFAQNHDRHAGHGEARAAPAHSPVTPPAILPPMTVHKHPACGCCGVWIEHMKRAGFQVAEKNVEDMGPVKDAAGVPAAMGSCHTAHVGGYFVEGHVPAKDVLRLLRERPDAKGFAVPGMPLGSPGMEHPDGIVQPYAVSLVLRDGSVREFSRHGGD